MMDTVRADAHVRWGSYFAGLFCFVLACLSTLFFAQTPEELPLWVYFLEGMGMADGLTAAAVHPSLLSVPLFLFLLWTVLLFCLSWILLRKSRTLRDKHRSVRWPFLLLALVALASHLAFPLLYKGFMEAKQGLNGVAGLDRGDAQVWAAGRDAQGLPVQRYYPVELTNYGGTPVEFGVRFVDKSAPALAYEWRSGGAPVALRLEAGQGFSLLVPLEDILQQPVSAAMLQNPPHFDLVLYNAQEGKTLRYYYRE